MGLCVALLAFLAILHSDVGVEAAKRKSTRPRREVLASEGPSDEQVWDSGLMERSLSFVTLVEKGHTYYEDIQKRFQGYTLGFVTPWNARGYDIAVKFRNKFSAISPVWYQLKRGEGENLEPGTVRLTGSHDVDQGWIKKLREGGRGPKVLPRVLVELDPQGHVELLSNPVSALDAILREVEEQQFDGIVLEVWMVWHAMNGLNNEGFRNAAVAFVGHLSRLLASRNKSLVLAIPPLFPSNHKAAYTDRVDFLELAQHVEAFAVMTYDYSSGSPAPGPNSPMEWVTANLDLMRKGPIHAPEPAPEAPSEVLPKYLLGVNFYGWEWAAGGGPNALTAKDVVPLLKRHQPAIEWDDRSEEHWFEFTDDKGVRHVAYYPTPRALEMRMEAAAKAGVGLSIWELGQGFERFLDLL